MVLWYTEFVVEIPHPGWLFFISLSPYLGLFPYTGLFINPVFLQVLIKDVYANKPRYGNKLIKHNQPGCRISTTHTIYHKTIGTIKRLYH